MERYANWRLALQYCFILVVNALMLFSMAVLCTALTACVPKLGVALLVFSWGWYIIVGFVNILTFQLMAKISERNEIAANLRLKEAEAQASLEYAELIKSNAARLTHWQHDMNKVIANVCASTRNEEVLAAMNELSIKISLPAVPDYTGNLLLNTCLASQMEQAQELNVRLHLQVDLPKDVPMSGIELVRIFSNLLDNAIRAASVLPNPLERVVDAECRANAGFLYITTRNRYIKEATPHGTGQGAVILRKFAEQYHGVYTNKQDDGEWFAQLALKL